MITKRPHYLHPLAALLALVVLMLIASIAHAGTLAGTVSGTIYFDPLHPGEVVTLNAPGIGGWLGTSRPASNRNPQA